MSSEEKIKALNYVINSVESPNDQIARIKKASKFLAIFSWVLLVTVFIFYFQGITNVALLAISAISGILFGVTLFIDFILKQWVFITPHINLDSVKQEVKSIEI